MDYFTIQDVSLQTFFQLPKTLVYHPKYKKLSASAKLAYAILRDRHSVSVKNGWVDNEGRVYFLFSDQELAEILDCTVRTANKHKNSLQEVGLIHMKRRGQNKKNLIYLLKPEPLPEADRKKSSNPDRKKTSDLDMKKTSDPDRKKTSRSSKTNFSNTDFSDTNISKSSSNKREDNNIVIENIERKDKREEREEEESTKTVTIHLLKSLGYNDYIVHDIVSQMQKYHIQNFTHEQIITQHHRMVLWVEKHGEIHEWGTFFVEGILKYENSRRVINRYNRMKPKKEKELVNSLPVPLYNWLERGE